MAAESLFTQCGGAAVVMESENTETAESQGAIAKVITRRHGTKENKEQITMIQEAFGEVITNEKLFTRVKEVELGFADYGKILQDLVNDMQEVKNVLKGNQKKEESSDENMTCEMKKMKMSMEELRIEMLKLKKQNTEHEDEKKRMMKERDEEKRKLNEMIDKLKTENMMLKRRLDNEVKEQKDNIERMQKDQEGWKKVQDEKEIDLRKIIGEQQVEQKEKLEQEMIKLIKKKENVIRSVVDKKKCTIVFGLEEKHNLIRYKREREETQNIKEVIQVLNDEEEEALEKEIDEVQRIGKYKEGGKRPIRIKFKSQTAAMEVLQRTGKLKETEKYKSVWIKKDLNEEERVQEKELWNEMKEKNGQRSEEEKKKFYFKVRDGKIKKWYM